MPAPLARPASVSRAGHPAAAAVFLAAASVLAAAAAVPPAEMAVGQGEAWVRVHFPPSGKSELQTLRWDDPPDGLDPDTLRIWSPKRPASLKEWRWVEDADTPPPDPGAPLVWTPDGGPSAGPSAAAPRHRPLELLLDAPLSDAMGHSLTFRLPGFSWTAHYHMTVRGLGPTSLKQAQIDCTGTVRIDNATDTAWPGVRLSFAGPRDAPPDALAPPKPVGSPELDREAPLAAPWFPPDAPEPAVPSVWPLRLPADLAAGVPTEIPFMRVVRKPAAVVHVYDSGLVPLPTPAPGVALERRLAIPNTREMGLGFPLLPGRLDWSLASRAAHPDIHVVTVPHTPCPGVLHVPLGAVGAIRAAREARPPVDYPDGTRQIDCTILFSNDLDGEADIDATERPPAAAWNLVSSSIPCTVADDALRFSFPLPGHSRKALTYRIRLPAPAK